jgi:hypothetical protein
MKGAWGGKGMNTQFWSENLKTRDKLGELGVSGWILLLWFLNK